jgi:hypothetical protein
VSLRPIRAGLVAGACMGVAGCESAADFFLGDLGPADPSPVPSVIIQIAASTPNLPGQATTPSLGTLVNIQAISPPPRASLAVSVQGGTFISTLGIQAANEGCLPVPTDDSAPITSVEVFPLGAQVVVFVGLMQPYASVSSAPLDAAVDGSVDAPTLTSGEGDGTVSTGNSQSGTAPATAGPASDATSSSVPMGPQICAGMITLATASAVITSAALPQNDAGQIDAAATAGASAEAGAPVDASAELDAGAEVDAVADANEEGSTDADPLADVSVEAGADAVAVDSASSMPADAGAGD